jgi:23S rRNA (guanine745-N1)-methyltransferase
MQESIWMCPVCEGPLARGEKSFACAAGHSFDIAREGYVNLVLAQHRRSAAAGDPKDSLRHRRAFLDEGHYAPLAAALVDLLAGEAPDRVLDAGCGEGYYLRQLALSPALGGVRLYGVDVAKEAIRLAAKAAPSIEFGVGNTYRLPVLGSSVAAVLQVFAPCAPQQLRRVLRAGGLFLEVKPGPRHLEVLRAMIYDQPQAHTGGEIPEGFEALGVERVTFPLILRQPGEVAGLVEMTPYKWHMNPETYGRVRELTELEDTADFAIGLFRPMGDAT